MTPHAIRRFRRAHVRTLAARVTRGCALAVVFLEIAQPAARAAVTTALADLSMEELMEESVTSVSKKNTKLTEAPAAISVVTGDDIRRLGITSLPEALRLVPGLDVARVDASHWAISSRGFNLPYANKLLVLMDGRSLYTPAYGGVPWNMQDMVLEDLDRIEVIRGPGATLWGANAVNGVINITSKSSKDTQGLLVTTAAGNELQPLTNIRYGGQLNPQLFYRAYFQYSNREGLLDASGRDAGDDWNTLRGGFRSDWQASVQDLVTLQGDYFSHGMRERVSVPSFTPPYSTYGYSDNASQGANLIARWTRTLAEDSHFSLQTYYDAYETDIGVNGGASQTGDVEAEYRFALGDRHDLVSGVGYRYTTDKFRENDFVRWSDNSRALNLYSAFIQDEITVVPEHLRLTLGTKAEHNDYTGWEIQPSARLLWTPTERQSVWAAASHAVATPARIYRDSRIRSAIFPASPAGPLIETVLTGAQVSSEELDAYELGYRVEVTPDLSFDVAAFYNVYDDLIGYPAGPGVPTATPVPHLSVPLTFANNVHGETYGTEWAAQWRATDQLRLQASYSVLKMHLHSATRVEAGNPQQQAGVQAFLTLPWNLELNAAAFYVDRIAAQQLDAGTIDIPAYLRADLGLIWHANENLEVGVFGQNLLDGSHPEFASQNSRTITEIPRTFFGRLTWRF